MRYLLLALLPFSAFAQFNPGFDTDEYREMLLILARTADDEEYAANFPEPEHQLVYRSEPIGLDNQWDLWYDDVHHTAVISVRGTTPNPDSWLLNFYAAMVPAQGEISYEVDGELQTYSYKYAEDEDAAVHAGWALGTRMMLNDIMRESIQLYYQEDVTDFYIVGHSQGGAIAYLLTAQMRYLQQDMMLPSEWRFKTYCSAAPKPGNLYFAYDYEATIQNGWGFNVVNSADWVPEVPISIQTLEDFNGANPFVHIDDMVEQQSLMNRIGLWWVLRKLERPTEKAQENYESFLGNYINRDVSEKIAGLMMPEYFPSNNYVRVGIQIVLHPDSAYYNEFPEDPDVIFRHHIIEPYLYLAEQLETPFYSNRRSYVGKEWTLTQFRNEEGEMEGFSYSPRPFILFSQNGRIRGFIDENDPCYWDINYIHSDRGLTVYRDPQSYGGCETDHPVIEQIRRCNRLETRGNQLLLMSGETVLMLFEHLPEE